MDSSFLVRNHQAENVIKVRNNATRTGVMAIHLWSGQIVH